MTVTETNDPILNLVLDKIVSADEEFENKIPTTRRLAMIANDSQTNSMLIPQP